MPIARSASSQGIARRPLDLVEWAAILGLGLLLLLPTGSALGVSLAVSPDDLDSGKVQLTPTCPHRLNGGPGCISCGMTRAFASASRGRFGDAWRFNRAAVPLYALTLTLFAGSLGTTLVAARGLRRRLARSRGENP